MTDQGPNREEAKQGEEAKQEGGGGPLDQVQDTVGGVTKDLPIVGGGGDDEEEGGGPGGGLL